MSESPPPAEPAQPAEPAPAPQAEGGKTSGLAIASLICGIVGLCCVPSGIAAIITGAMALSRIKTSGQGGKGLAIAGIVLGCIGIVLSIWALATGRYQIGGSGDGGM